MNDAKYDAVQVTDAEHNPSAQESVHQPTLQENEASSTKKTREKVGLMPVRYQMAFLAFFGMTSLGAMRQNLGVAITAMVNTSYASHESTDLGTSIEEEEASCWKNGPNITEGFYDSSGEFPWDTHTQELLLAAFFYGYVWTQIPGGWLSDRFGSKWVIGLGVLTSSVCTILGPWAVRTNTALFFVTRFFAGFSEGGVVPALASMWSQWAHPNERSRLGVIGFTGMTLGLVLGNVVGGLLIESHILGGWPLPFYIFGSMGCTWFIVWCSFASSSPADHRWISTIERKYIERSLKLLPKRHRSPVPWLSIFRSPLIWGIIFCHFVQGFAFFTLVTNLPLYYTKGLGLSVWKAGLFSAVPYILQFFWNLISASAADAILSRNILSLSHTRKLVTNICYIGNAGFLVVAGLAQCNVTLSVTFVTLAAGFNGAVYSGYYISIVDVAGMYAGSVTAIANTGSSLGGVTGPYVVSILTEVQTNIFGWQMVLWIIAILFFTGALVFTFIGKVQLQPWAQIKEIV